MIRCLWEFMSLDGGYCKTTQKALTETHSFLNSTFWKKKPSSTLKFPVNCYFWAQHWNIQPLFLIVFSFIQNFCCERYVLSLEILNAIVNVLSSPSLKTTTCFIFCAPLWWVTLFSLQTCQTESQKFQFVWQTFMAHRTHNFFFDYEPTNLQ